MPDLVPGHAEILDQPVAGLIKDLKQRDLLKDTLIVCCTEFGRMPMFQVGNNGRDHNPEGYTVWMAGGGVKGGFSYGATDPFGYKAEVNPLSIHDVHATMLHLLGLDHALNLLSQRFTKASNRIWTCRSRHYRISYASRLEQYINFVVESTKANYS